MREVLGSWLSSVQPHWMDRSIGVRNGKPQGA